MAHYRGVSAHHNVPRVTDYESAVVAQRSGAMRSKIASMYERHDGAIAFRLYETDVVVWHPDNSVEIDNFGTLTTSGFAKHFLPVGIHLHYPTTRRNVVGGSNTISFRAHLDRPDLVWDEVYHVCQGHVVRFTEQDGVWLPDDDTCFDIRLPVGTDRRKSRQLAKQYYLKDFESWVTMAPRHLDIEHNGWSLDRCMSALELRDFRTAAEYMPTIVETSAFGHRERMQPLPIETVPGQYISMASLAKLRLAIFEYEGALAFETDKTWSQREFAKGMKKVREMERLGLRVSDLGPMV